MRCSPLILPLLTALPIIATAQLPPISPPDKRPAQPPQVLPAPVPPALPPASPQLATVSADDQTASQVRDTLTQIVNDALTPGRFADLISHLAKDDHTRLLIPPDHPQKVDDLDKTLTQFRQDFRSKYNQDFNLTAKDLMQATITLGQDKLALTISLSDLEKNPAVDTPSTPDKKPVSVVSGPTVNLLQEGRSASGQEHENLWKLNIPNEIGAAQLRQNLTKHIQKLDDQKSTWSSDHRVTARAAATEVFQALTDNSIVSDQP